MKKQRIQTGLWPVAPGQDWWRSVEEYIGRAPQATETDEFAPLAGAGGPAMGRREFVKLMGASMALAGIGGCGAPTDEEILPYAHPPQQGTQGEARHYATAVTLNGYASAVLATSYMGRPVKLEGNSHVDAIAGATDSFTQAAILQLWDPDRSALVLNEGVASSWDGLLAALNPQLRRLQKSQGAGLRVLTGNIASPSLRDQLQSLQHRYPQARWHQYEPICDDNVAAGTQLAFGASLQQRIHLQRARCVLSLDADLLGPGPEQVLHAQQFAQARRRAEQGDATVRLYAVETYPTLTGAAADHRLALRGRDIESLARALAVRFGAPGEVGGAASNVAIPGDWLDAVSEDLQTHEGAALVVAGARQPAAVHALVRWINQRLGAVGNTLSYQDSVVRPEQQMQGLRELTHAMHAGQVEMLLILGANPVYSAPADLDFGAALDRVPLSVHLGLYADETAVRSHWHVPAAHELESWGDARASDGTVTIQQPLIKPLYGGHSAQALLAAVRGVDSETDQQRVQNYWREHWESDAGEKNDTGAPGGDFDQRWRDTLRAGVLVESAMPARTASTQSGLFAHLPSPAAPPSAPSAGDALEINFAPDATLWDGRYANNAWLQELPKPLTQLTWDNAALISPATAAAQGIEAEQIIELHYRGEVLRAPVWIAPGHADGAVTLSLGYGRWRGGRIADGLGVNANRLRQSTAPWFDQGLTIRATTARYPLATTQVHHRMHDRQLVRAASVEEFQRDPHFAKRPEADAGPSLYPPYDYPGHAWGMSINLNTCIGCGACTIACQAENNIPVVGKAQVRNSREMHWIRVDRYYQGPPEDPQTLFQPVPCMHCEHAPCEVVCPVGATLHDGEGLNVQVYNRCIGTRFCSNNCPYKVRRFNFLQYSKRESPALAAQRNPEVTVRMRGVMEKCTYCIQRIERSRIAAQREDRTLQDGDIQTACQQVCPTQAILFGDLNDPVSRVRKLKDRPLDYALLGELNTRPRTTYSAKLRNPNPVLRRRS